MMNQSKTNLFALTCNEFFALAAFGETENVCYVEALRELIEREPKINAPARDQKAHARPLMCGKFSGTRI